MPYKEICPLCKGVVNYCKDCEGKTDDGDMCDCCDVWNPALRERTAEPNKDGDYICINCKELEDAKKLLPGM